MACMIRMGKKGGKQSGTVRFLILHKMSKNIVYGHSVITISSMEIQSNDISILCKISENSWMSDTNLALTTHK